MREWLTRLIDWMHRDRLGSELDEELRFHRQQLERDAVNAGADPDEARRTARRRLGNVTRIREDSRERWKLPTLDHLQQDLRYALRGLRRSPGFTTTVIATLALGIGANAAMFGVVDRLMFRPFPYLADPETVHRVYLTTHDRGVDRVQSGGIEYTTYLDIKRFTTSFSKYAGFAHVTLALGNGDAARERRVAVVSASFFDFFTAKPALGRFFTAAEDTTPIGADVAVLSYDYWQREFGGRNVLGEPLQVGHIPTTIIGVAPRGFTGVNDAEPPPVYIPITLYGGSNTSAEDRARFFTRYEWGWMSIMVRRKPGVTVEEASADVNRAHRRSWDVQREIERGVPDPELAKPGGMVSAMKLGAGPDPSLEARTALWLLGVAAIVLLIACANVANLFLARALRRRREIAVRLALGVSRRRLALQMLAEGLLLSLIGSVAGLAVAHWGGAAIRRMLIATPDTSLETFTDWRTLGVVIGLALLTGVLTGLAPAMLLRNGDLAGALKAGAREGTYHRSRVRSALLVAQGALSVVLLIGAGLFVKSLNHVMATRMGYDAEHVLLVSRNFRGLNLDSAQRVALRRQLVATAQAIPGVEHAAWVSSVPFWSTSTTGFSVPGIDSVARLGRFRYTTTTPDYFGAMGTRILRGRGFTDADRQGAPLVAVVSIGMARVLWPDRDAIGQCIRVGRPPDPCMTVVGVAEDIVQDQEQLPGGPRYNYYLPIEQFRPTGGNYVMVRMRGPVAPQAETVRKALQAVMPGESYVTVRPLVEIVDDVRRSWRLGSTVFVAFGLLAVLVAAVGLYGVIAYNVTQRMHELGVRAALGAKARDIVRLVVGQSARFALAGVVVGVLLALLSGRWLQPLLFEQSARDPAIYVAVGAVMMAVAIIASMAPALRAAAADPNTALRGE